MGQGQLRVIIYINFVELELRLLNAMFHDHRTISSVGEDFKRFLVLFTIQGHGGHLGRVTWTIYINFLSHFPRRIHMKFGIDWPSGFRKDV